MNNFEVFAAFTGCSILAIALGWAIYGSILAIWRTYRDELKWVQREQRSAFAKGYHTGYLDATNKKAYDTQHTIY